MARIDLPEGDGEEAARLWSLRPDLGDAVRAFGAALAEAERLPLRIREAARIRIAHLNGCAVCVETRIDGGERYGLDERFYADVVDPARRGDYAPAEALAIGFAERFVAGEASFDAAFWDEMNVTFAAAEIVELAACCTKWLGLGRLNAVLDLARSCPIRLPTR